jgi:hypothetical protein
MRLEPQRLQPRHDGLLHAEDEPAHPDYPKGTEFKVRFGPRGVLRCTATAVKTPGDDPRFGKWGGYRVPALLRWPGVVKPRTEINEIFSAEDWVATLVAAAGEPNIKATLAQGYRAGATTFKVLSSLRGRSRAAFRSARPWRCS